MDLKVQDRERIRNDLYQEVRLIRIFATSVIFSAAAVASSTILIFIPNLETLSLFIFIVGYQYGAKTGTMTIFTSVTIYEIFASQVYGTGGIIPFLLKFPPFFLFMFGGMYFNSLKHNDLTRNSTPDGENRSSMEETSHTHEKSLYNPPSLNFKPIKTSFTAYERLLLAQLGLALTIVWDVITSLGMLVFIPTWEGFLVTFLTGIPFLIFHQITNCLLFATIPSIVIALDRARFL